MVQGMFKLIKRINDNGSGSATTLEILNVFSKINFSPKNKIRFCFFSGEELGILIIIERFAWFKTLC
jgi:hypothetical protein